MPTIRRSTVNVVAGLVALSMIAALVIRTSSAVFTAETNNVGNSLEAGTIVLSDNGDGSALLEMKNIAPGEYSRNCIRVLYDGTLDPEEVRVYSESAFVTTGASNMENQVYITIEEGSGGTFDDCSGFTPSTMIVGDGPASATPTTLAAWDASATDYTSGDGVWDPAGPGAVRTYRVTLELDLATGNAYQGAELTGINLTWSTRSTASPGEVPFP